jgi:5-(carboxyamino)imidazole ribonucleotide synthase
MSAATAARRGRRAAPSSTASTSAPSLRQLGIVGGGQLGRMMALAGHPLGLQFLFLDRSDDTPAAQVARSLVGDLGNPRLLRELASRSEVLGFDWENVSVPALRAATRGLPVRVAPPLRALATAQDRLSEKRCFERLRIPTTQYAAVSSRAALLRAVRDIGLPGVLKTRRMGYDGKGQAVIRNIADAEAAWATMGSVPLLYEGFIAFECEVSCLAVRGRDGDIAFYPLSRNVHRDGILRVTVAPWRDASLERAARRHLRALMQSLNYVGVLAVEFFVSGGRLIANEMAPRVHNSGHWTIEGAVTSQFENHVRALAGLPLGSTEVRGHSGMVNLIGAVPGMKRWLCLRDLHLHDYGKEPRAGRKVGHVTVLRAQAAQRDDAIRRLAASLYPELGRIL